MFKKQEFIARIIDAMKNLEITAKSNDILRIRRERCWILWRLTAITYGNFYRVPRQSISQFDNECDFLTRHFYNTVYYWRVASRTFSLVSGKDADYRLHATATRGEKAHLRKPGSVRELWTASLLPPLLLRLTNGNYRYVWTGTCTVVAINI